jgi:3-oxoacyl-[acyl-carrier-protein] synthase-3
MKGIKILGIGAYVPENVITNDDLTQLMDTSDEWIASRTGIRERRVVSGDTTVADLAIKAAQDALKSANVTADTLDLIIVGTSTPDMIYPGVCCRVQDALGAPHAAGFDLALACTGFVASLVTAEQFLRTGMYKRALVIGADIHSRFMDWTDRNTSVLFGDGAGAMIVEASETENHLFASELHIDGTKGCDLKLQTNITNCPLVEPRSAISPYLTMNGREVFKFAVGLVPTSIQSALKRANIGLNDFDYLVLHQANHRIMQAMTEKLGIEPERMVFNLDRYGNTSAASIPLVMNEAVLTGKVKPGDVLVLCGFGGGLSWGSTILRWTAVDHRLQDQQSVQEPATVAP